MTAATPGPPPRDHGQVTPGQAARDALLEAATNGAVLTETMWPWLVSDGALPLWEAAAQAANDAQPQGAPAVQAGAADKIIRDILESLCRRDGLSLESTIEPGEPARNYALAERLGIGHVFGLPPEPQPQPAPEDVLYVTPGDGTPIGGLLAHVGLKPQPAPGCPDPAAHVIIRDITGREVSHQETTHGTAPQPAPGGLLDPLHALAAKWDANAARNQRNGQALMDQGDEYGSEGLVVAEALGACVVDLRAVLADYPDAPSQPAPGDVLCVTPGDGTPIGALMAHVGLMPQPAPELAPVDSAHLYHWRFDRGEEFGLYRQRADADAMAAKHAGEGLSEVLSLAILGRPEQPAPEQAAAMAALAADLEAALREIDGLNDLIRDMFQAFPDTADEPQWRDRAGALNVHDPDGQPYRALTEEDLLS